jgi:hypothetical protein
MNFKFYRVEAFKIVGPYKLSVSFDDGTSQNIDFLPVLFGRMYGPLRDLKLFEQVTIDPEVHTLVWPNGADFNPALLHDWNTNAEDIRRSAAELDTVKI